MIRNTTSRTIVGLFLLLPLSHQAWADSCGADSSSAYNNYNGLFNAPFDPARYSFAALKADGSISAWGDADNGGANAPTDDGYLSIFSTQKAFAALKADGSIRVWGNAGNGGANAPIDSGYVSISSNGYALAALKEDGSISAWGESFAGGDNSPIGTDYVSISSSTLAFAALKADGSISVWGTSEFGGANAPTDSGYLLISSNQRAFAALRGDGSISAWGRNDAGGANAPSDAGYVSISSTSSAFAALKTDGSISSWGNSSNGGSNAPTDAGYVSISSNNFAFSALKADGSISVWGSSFSGDTNAPTDVGYVSISSTSTAFAAVKDDSTISTWGNSGTGGANAPSDDGYVSISSNYYAFAALKTDGRISAWGNSSYGGTNAPTDSGYVSIGSNDNAFAALKADGSISVWGDSSYGGANAPNDTGYVSINNRGPLSSPNCTMVLFLPTIGAALADMRTNENAVYSFTLPANTFSSADVGDTLTLSASGLPDWLSFVSSTGVLSGTPAQADVGEHSITVRATDSVGAFVEDTMLITVDKVNTAPLLSTALSDQSADEDVSFSFTLPANTFSDADVGDTLTLSASSLPDWLSFVSSTGVLSGTPVQADVGEHSITVRATDGSGAFVEDSMRITVDNVNDTPTVAIEVTDQSVDQEGLFTFEVPAGTFIDADTGQSLTLSAVDLPDWLSFNATNGTFSGTPGNTQVGDVTVTVQATDSSGALVQDSFVITVYNVNDTPLISTALSDQSADENASFSFTLPANTFSDADVGDTLTLSASGLPDWLSFVSSTGLLSGTPAQADVGEHSITVRATDSVGAFVEDTMLITVSDTPLLSQVASCDANYSTRSGIRVEHFAALKADGSISAWGRGYPGFANTPTDNGYVSITLNQEASAALKADGTISTWGQDWAGGANGPTDDGYVSIHANESTFVALKDDGSISYWGQPSEYLTTTTPAPSDDGYVSITSSNFSHAALKADGSISVWGIINSGGSGAPTDDGYVSISSTLNAFAALKADGSISVWGYSGYGGADAPSDDGYVSISSTSSAFAALKNDGSISAWGRDYAGGADAPSDDGYVSISSTSVAFAALKNDGSISVWGDRESGAVNAPMDDGYVSISANSHNFAAMKADGSISVWGNSLEGAPSDDGYVSITSNGRAFAALKADGSISVWGSSLDGGRNAPTDNGYVSISSAYNSFSALNADGRISHWGDTGPKHNRIVVKAPLDFGHTLIAGWPLQSQSGCTTINPLPIVSAALIDRRIDEGAMLNFTIPVNTLTLSAVDVPDWLSFDAESGSFLGTPGESDIGSYTITVQATDAGGLSVEKSFKLEVAKEIDIESALSGIGSDIDLPTGTGSGSDSDSDSETEDGGDNATGTVGQGEGNSLPPVISSSDTVNVAENVTGIVHNITLSVSDEAVSFTLEGDDAAQFTLNETSGALRSMQVLNFEAPADANNDGVYELRVTAKDSADNSTTQTLRISISDVNEVPVVLAQTFQVNEFTEVGTLIRSVVGKDPEGANLTWSLLVQNSPFAVDQSGALSLTGELDFESISAYLLNVQANDGELSTIGEVRVNVTDDSADQASIWLQLEQDDKQVQQIRSDGGLVSVTVQVANPVSGLETSYDWSQSSDAVLDQATVVEPESETLVFSPAGMSADDELTARITVTRDGVNSEGTLELQVAAAGTTAQETVDSDGDGILDAFEGALGANADTTVANKLQTLRGDDVSNVMASEPGTLLRLGSVARAAMVNQSLVTLEDLVANLPAVNMASLVDTLPDKSEKSVSEVFDFEIAGLSEVGKSVRVVLPLKTALAAGAQYMKLHPSTGWQAFVSNSANGLRSAPSLAGITGQCPLPGGDGWVDGLVAGHTCIELRIEDGGVNDADSYDEQGRLLAALGLNGSIKDPGAIVNPSVATQAPSLGAAEGDGVVRVGSLSGGQAGLWLLALFIGLLGSRSGWYRRVAHQRVIGQLTKGGR